MNTDKHDAQMRRLGLLLLLGLLFINTACREQAPQADLPTPASVAELDETVAAAVAATVAAAQAETAAAMPPPTWTAIPQLTPTTSPTQEATLPPPPTSTVLPTDTPAVTETAAIPTNTPQPTETAVPPTNTPAPAEPQPTNPPPAPTDPPPPVFSGNILPNASFEDGWYNLYGIPELQLPNNWGFEWDEGATGFGSEPWDVWVRPETRVLPDFQLPAGERGLFIQDGQYTIKMFKGNGAISFRMFQDINLPAGTYLFQVRAYPDLVMGYNNGQKIFADDPLAGEIRFIAPGGGSGWLPPAFGTWNTLEHLFTVDTAQTVRIGIAVRGRYALSNNGWFFDNWSLAAVQN